MLLIHKETAEIYEVRIKNLIGESSLMHLTHYSIGEIALLGKVAVTVSHNELADNFEILGWL